jgi:hypothetical protein
VNDEREYPYIAGAVERSLPVDDYAENRDFAGTIVYHFGSGPALFVVQWLGKADELDTVKDLVRELRKRYGDTIANFALGYFGGGGELDIESKKIF